MSVNRVTLIGRLGNNPEMRYTGGGMAVANFNVATSENWNDKSGQKQERTEWHRIVVWGKLAELCGQYLTKGRQCYIEGRLQTREWEDKTGAKRYTTEIVANQVQFLGSASAGAGASTGASAGAALSNGAANASDFDMPAPTNMAEASFTEDEIPF